MIFLPNISLPLLRKVQSHTPLPHFNSIQFASIKQQAKVLQQLAMNCLLTTVYNRPPKSSIQHSHGFNLIICVFSTLINMDFATLLCFVKNRSPVKLHQILIYNITNNEREASFVSTLITKPHFSVGVAGWIDCFVWQYSTRSKQ